MIKDAVRSLKKDWDRAVFYWIVFVLSSMFMFTFFHLALSDAIGVTFIYSNNDLPTYLTVFDVLICIIVIFLANDFYVKKKSGELAVILICGGTYLQLVEFLLIQTGILMILSIPVGIGLGCLAFPAISLLMKTMSGYGIEIEFGLQSVVLTACVIIMEVFWCTMVNLGYTYRNSIYTLLHVEDKIKLSMFAGLKETKIRYIYPVLYLGCAVLLYTCGKTPERMLLFGFAGTAGLWGSINRVMFPWLEKAVLEKWGDDGEKLVYMGLFRNDLKMARLYVVLFIATANILCSVMAGTVNNSGEFALCLLSFGVIIPLLALSFMFRFATEALERKKQFDVLRKTGYMEEQIRKIKNRELLWIYGFIMIAALIYILNIVAVLVIYGRIPGAVGGGILLIFTGSLAVCGLINRRQYEKDKKE
jgi:hypothetical protein